MTREVIGRWPLVVEVEIDEEEFRFAVEMQDLGAIPRGDFDRVRGGIRFCSQAHPNLSGVHSVAHTVYVLGSEVLADDEWSVNTWPASRLPEFRAAVEQLVEELRAEHNPGRAKPSDHEMEHVSIRGPADEEPKPETTCTAWGCLRTRDRERLYCDPCGGRLTSADVDPHHLTQWPPREDEPEEELRVTGESIPMASSVRDAAQQSFERHRLIGESVDVAADLYAHLDVYDLAAARREYARLGELLRELEGS